MVQNKAKRKCRYIPTGKIYESVVEMCNDLGFSEHKARHQIHGRVKNTLQIEFVSESFVGKKLKSRVCSSCGIEKDINHFGFEKNGTSRSRCKKCRSNKEKERRDSKTSKQLRIERIASTYKITKKQLLNTPKSELIDEVKKNMEYFFNSNNLLELAEKLYDLHLHFCDEIKKDDIKKNYYLCSHS